MDGMDDAMKISLCTGERNGGGKGVSWLHRGPFLAWNVFVGKSMAFVCGSEGVSFFDSKTVRLDSWGLRFFAWRGREDLSLYGLLLFGIGTGVSR